MIKAKSTSTKQTVYRSSETGQFVKKATADRHPRTTEKQHIKKGK